MYLNPKLKEAYSKERLTAREAQEKAEWIAWGPVVFQVSRLMKKFGIFEMLRNSDNGMTEADAQAYIKAPTAEAIAPYLEDLADSFNLKDADGAYTEEVAEKGLDVVVAEKIVESQNTPKIPLSTIFLILCGLCTSIMWGGIFNLSVEGLGKYTEQASGIFMTMVVGGGIMPLLQDFLSKGVGYLASYWIVVAMLVYILFYALVGSKNVNKDIPVE